MATKLAFLCVPCGTLALWFVGCGGSSTPPPQTTVQVAEASTDEPEQDAAPAAPANASPLTDMAAVAFRADFSRPELGLPWNTFGLLPPRREAMGGNRGLWLRIVDAEKNWDAIGVRTSRVRLEGDFDLRGRFDDFDGTGNVSAKLIVVDASSPRGEAAYVERLQIDGKNLFKFGGEVQGTLETWGMMPSELRAADLRLSRKAGLISAFARADDKNPWTPIGKSEKAPPSMPRVLKFGVKLSAGYMRSAQVRWTDLTMDGAIVRGD